MGKKRIDGRLQKNFRVNGKRYIVYGRSVKELVEKEMAKRSEIEQGREKRRNPTFSEYCETWQDSRKGLVSQATSRTQEKLINVIKAVSIKSIGLKFGEIKLKDITIEDLRELQSKLKENRQTQTVNDYMALVKHIMSDATKQRLLDYNPCVLIKNLKRVEEQARDAKHRALSIEEQTTFFTCERCKNSSYYNILRFAVNTGMRGGEIGALRQSDIYDGMIHVQRTITRNESGTYILGTDAKTKAGIRAIPVNEQIKSIIEEQKRNNEILFGNIQPIDDILFKATEGGLLNVTAIDRDIKKICQSCGVEHFTLHALRATFATRALEAGMSPKVLQEILGHKSFSMTMDLYAHALNDTKRDAMNNLRIVV